MPKTSPPTLDLAALERLAIVLALKQTSGNKVRASRLLGIHVRTLHRKLLQLKSEAEVIQLSTQ